jgi:hypothetical protein
MGVQIIRNDKPSPKKPKGVVPQINSKKILSEQEIQVGQVWHRPITVKEGNQQVVRQEDVLVIVAKGNFIVFVAKAAFDHGDVCGTYSMKKDAFRKMFSR